MASTLREVQVYNIHKGTNPSHYKMSVDLVIDGDKPTPDKIHYRLLVNDRTDAEYLGNVNAEYLGNVNKPQGAPHGHFFLTDRGVEQLHDTAGYKSNLLLVRTDAIRSASVAVSVDGGPEMVRELDVENEIPLVEDANW